MLSSVRSGFASNWSYDIVTRERVRLCHSASSVWEIPVIGTQRAKQALIERDYHGVLEVSFRIQFIAPDQALAEIDAHELERAGQRRCATPAHSENRNAARGRISF